jgi:very-short-patch-repair endonuclease
MIENKTDDTKVHFNSITINDTKILTLNCISNIWYYASQIASLLNYKQTTDAIRTVVSHHNKSTYNNLVEKYGKPVNHHKNIQPHTIFINKDGITDLVSKSNKLQCDKIVDYFGINTVTRYKRKEIEILDELVIFLNVLNCEFHDQYIVDGYKIDMYLPTYKLAIEIDEHNHDDINEEYEQNRQKYIENKLGCTFLRVNPDDANFSVTYFIGLVSKYIINYSAS